MPMPSRPFHCITCGRAYRELEEAEVCEAAHDTNAALHRAEGPTQVAGGPAPCAFCDGLPCRCYTPPILAPEELMRLGALTLDQESSEAVEKLLDQQVEVYLTKSKEELIQGLVDRDRLLANQGRQLSDGRSATRLLREFLRASLYRGAGIPNVQAVERALQAFGMEPADARQLKYHGSTLGPLESPEQVAKQLEDGTRKSRTGQ